MKEAVLLKKRALPGRNPPPSSVGPNIWNWIDPLGLVKTGGGHCSQKAEKTTSTIKGTFEDAIKARDEALVELDKLSNRKKADISTVVGAVNTKTGEVAVGLKSTKKYGNKLCAEDLAVEKLGGNSPDIKISPAIRPRTKEVIPVCKRCQTKYSKDQFPTDTKFD